MLKLDVKTKTASGVEFSSGGSSVLDTGKVNNAFLKFILGVVAQDPAKNVELDWIPGKSVWNMLVGNGSCR